MADWLLLDLKMVFGDCGLNLRLGRVHRQMGFEFLLMDCMMRIMGIPLIECSSHGSECFLQMEQEGLKSEQGYSLPTSVFIMSFNDFPLST